MLLLHMMLNSQRTNELGTSFTHIAWSKTPVDMLNLVAIRDFILFNYI